MSKQYTLPEYLIDEKELLAQDELAKVYEKMIAPTSFSQAMKKAGEHIPASVKSAFGSVRDTISENDLFLKSMYVLAKSFETLEQYAARVSLSEKEVLRQVNAVVPDNEISKLDEVCLARSYDISKLVNQYKTADIAFAATEGAATGYFGFAGIPFNLVLSTFLFYRAVQSVAMFYGYDVKNDPAELQIASEVFTHALSPRNNNSSELSSSIAKVMLFTATTTMKQTIKKGWGAMAERGGAYLLVTQMRALANASARKALEKAGKSGLEKTVFSEVFEQVGKHLSQKAVGRAVPVIGAFSGCAIDAAQMVNILKFADVFYCKRFIMEKEMRINILVGPISKVDDYIDVCVVDGQDEPST